MMDLQVQWWLGKFADRIQEAALEVDDIVAQQVIFVGDSLVVFVQTGVVFHLGFQLFDVAFFPLPKGTLFVIS